MEVTEEGDAVSQSVNGLKQSAGQKGLTVCGSFHGWCFCVNVGNVYADRGATGAVWGRGWGWLTMMWRTGCINKLPYSKLSTVTEPRGWSRRGKGGEVVSKGGGLLCGDNFHLFFSPTILHLLQGLFFS